MSTCTTKWSTPSIFLDSPELIVDQVTISFLPSTKTTGFNLGWISGFIFLYPEPARASEHIAAAEGPIVSPTSALSIANWRCPGLPDSARHASLVRDAAEGPG